MEMKTKGSLEMKKFGTSLIFLIPYTYHTVRRKEDRT